MTTRRSFFSQTIGAVAGIFLGAKVPAEFVGSTRIIYGSCRSGKSLTHTWRAEKVWRESRSGTIRSIRWKSTSGAIAICGYNGRIGIPDSPFSD